MRRLISSAAIATALCVLMAIPASSATPTVGGPHGASMKFAFTATGPQQHFLAETASTSVDPEVTDSCAKPRCYSFPFSIAPSKKGLKTASMSAQITWTSPLARFWLHVVDVTKDPEIVASCFSFFASSGPSATVNASLPVARKYAIWVTVQQVIGATEPVKGVLHAPAKDQAPSSPLPTADRTGLFFASCEG